MRKGLVFFPGRGSRSIVAYHPPGSLTWHWGLSWQWRFWPVWLKPWQWLRVSTWRNPDGSGTRTFCIGPLALLYSWQTYHLRRAERKEALDWLADEGQRFDAAPPPKK